MNSRFARSLWIVALAHAVVLALLGALSGCRMLFRRPRPERLVPVEFTVAAPAEPVAEAAPLPAEEAPPPAPEPRVRRDIKVSRERVRRALPAPPSTERRLSSEEIRRLLAVGAKPADETSVPDEERRCLDLIRRAFYTAWVQPSAEEAGGAEAEVAVRLGPGGTISGASLVRPSGRAVLDDSVMKGVRSVTRIEGLTAGFLTRYPEVVISFRVE